MSERFEPLVPSKIQSVVDQFFHSLTSPVRTARATAGAMFARLSHEEKDAVRRSIHDQSGLPI